MRSRFVLFAFLVGCSGSSSVAFDPGPAPQAEEDAGSREQPGEKPDASVPVDGGSDAASRPDAPVVTGPEKLADGADLTLYGVTRSGHAVYVEGKTAKVVALAKGAAPSTIASGDVARVLIDGDTVFVWTGTDASVGALTAWTIAAGSRSLASASLLGVAASDGTRFVFTSNASGSTADLVGYNGAQPKTLLTNITTAGGAACAPELRFAATRFVTSHCGGAGSGTVISSFDPATWSRAQLQSGALNVWSADKAGTKVLVITAGTRSAQVVPIAGGTATSIETQVPFGLLTEDGSAVVYRHGAGLKRAATASPSPTTLVGSNVSALVALSPDGTRVLYQSQRSGILGDLFISSALGPATPVTLAGAANASIFGDAFTASASHVVFFKDVDTTSYVGTLEVRPLGGAGQPFTAPKTWVALAGQGARVVFNDNMTSAPGGKSTADIKVLDAASGVVKPIAAGARVDIALSPAKDRVVYGTAAGLFMAPIP